MATWLISLCAVLFAELFVLEVRKVPTFAKILLNISVKHPSVLPCVIALC